MEMNVNKEFYFDQIRASANKKSQLVITGFCSDDFMEAAKTDVYLEIKGEKKYLDSRWVMSKAPLIKKEQIGKEDITKMITFAIDLPDTIPGDATKLNLGIVYGGDRKELYSCVASRINRYLRELNCRIDSVSVDGKHLIIKGWAIDKEDIQLRLVKNIKSGEQDIKMEVNWYARPDVLRTYSECSDASEVGNVGFVITIDNNFDKMKLYVSTADKSSVFRINGSKGASKDSLSYNFRYLVAKGMFSLRNYGVKETFRKVKGRVMPKKQPVTCDYNKWIKQHMPSERELEKQRQTKFDYEPVFSIIVPLYESEEGYLNELVESVRNQTYGKWELCFSDGSKDSTRLTKIVGAMSAKDSRIKYIAKEKGPLGIAENTNQALSIATGDYVVLGDHDDLFTHDALYECVKAINEDKDIDVIYTDEDKIDMEGKEYFGPNFKPDFNLDYLRSNNYICHMFVAKREIACKIGGFDGKYNGSQDFDFIFKCVENAKKVYHIPKILYHWRAHSGSTASLPEAKMYAYDAGKRAIEAHYERMGLKASVVYGDHLGYYNSTFEVDGEPLLSIIIPNKDHIDDLKKCINSIENKSSYRNYEIIIVENNSNQEETFEYYREIDKKDNIHVLYWDKEFNYSAINNYGVGCAKGEYILLLNNDTEIINEDCLAHMLGYCQREDVGIVGARLYYEDDTIQHAGVVLGLGGVAGHAFNGMDEEEGLYQAKTKVASDYSAVTAACLMTKREIYEAVGGFDEELKVAFNDVDFCLKVRKLDKLVVYDANAKLYHYESKSRGLEDTFEKLQRFRDEGDILRERYGDILEAGDPYYNVNLTLDKSDFSLKI